MSVRLLILLMAITEMGNLSGAEVIAHRGESSAAPENTMSAIQAGIDAGAEMVEFDVRVTADGVLALFHDEELERITGKVGLFGGTSWGELSKLDVGKWFHPRFEGERIPTLAEAMRPFAGEGATALIERKSGSAELYAEALQEFAPEYEGIVVQSFDPAFLRSLRKLAPTLPLGLLGERRLTPARVGEIRAWGVDYVGWRERDLNAVSVGLVKKAEMKVLAWTVNDEARALQLLEMGVFGIITDRPREIRKAIDQRPISQE